MAAVTRALAGALTATIVTLGGAGHAAVSGPELALGFDDPFVPLASSGGTPLEVVVVTANGGSVAYEPVVDAAGVHLGTALRLPAYQLTAPPMAAIRVVDRTGTDDLSPGTSPFTFGADFTLDAASQGPLPDDGNNLIQRGLYGAAMQYKIEVDGGRPACRVKGSSGAVALHSHELVVPDTWYRVTCTRSGPTVTLQVTRLADGVTWTRSRTGTIGGLKPGSRTVPLSVGGKLRNAGQFMTSNSDQFNGRVDGAFLDIG